MNRDVLHALASGDMTLEEAEAFYDAIMDSEAAADAPQVLGMTAVEWTAFAQGVWFDELALWRQAGWPSSCLACGVRIAPADFGWLVKQTATGHRLVHITCPPDS